METGDPVVTVNTSRVATDLACSPDASTVATACADAKVRVFDLRSAKGGVSAPSSYSLGSLVHHRQWCTAVSWQPGSDVRLCSGSQEGGLAIWDLRSMDAPLHSLAAHAGQVLDVAWLPAPEAIVTGGSDAKVRVFQNGA